MSLMRYVIKLLLLLQLLIQASVSHNDSHPSSVHADDAIDSKSTSAKVNFNI